MLVWICIGFPPNVGLDLYRFLIVFGLDLIKNYPFFGLDLKKYRTFVHDKTAV